MTKEQMQETLDQATAEAAALKARNADLETANGKIAAELAAAKKQIEATAGANEILEGELKECRAERDNLKAENGRLAAAIEDARALDNAGDQARIADKGRLGILLGAIGKSCADHCPHHLDENACRNCSIFKMVFSAGYKITRPEPAKEV